jgi:3-hexulose-6-phosphate synthase
MRLQVALDGTLAESLTVLEAVHPYVDIAEIGTPLILREGVRAITASRQLYPNLPLLADFKIMDAGEIEAAIAFDAGADIVTVLGVTQEATLASVITTAQRYDAEVMVDLMQVPADRASGFLEIGCDYLCVHTSTDMRSMTPVAGLEALRYGIPHAPLAVAGGIRLETIDLLATLNPRIIIVGSAITRAADPAAAAQQFKERINAHARLS